MYRIEPEHVQYKYRGKFMLGDDRVDTRRLSLRRILKLNDRRNDFISRTLWAFGHKDEYGDYEMFDVRVRRKFGYQDYALALIQTREPNRHRGGYAIIFFRIRAFFVFTTMHSFDFSFREMCRLDDLQWEVAEYFNDNFNKKFLRISPIPYPRR